MSQPSTAREALIIEAIGEVAALIQRVEALAPSIDTARQALVQTSAGLSDQAAAFEHRMTAITENAKVQAIKHIARRSEVVARLSVDTQTRAMEEAARLLFRTEVGPALQRLVMPLQHLADRMRHPWASWLTHAATAALASATTLLLVTFLGVK